MTRTKTLTTNGSTATIYDTSDSDTKAYILGKIKQIMLGSPVLTANGTKTDPKTVKVGFVFCQFTDVQADSKDSIDADYKKLIGYQSDTSNELCDFIKNQSNGTVKLVLERHTTWVSLSGKVEEYKNNQNKIVQELDSLHDFNNDWQIAIIAFPNNYSGDPGTYFTETQGNAIGNSYCANGCQVDEDHTTHLKQTMNLIFLDPSVYKERRPEYTTIHEVCHALGLPDLYNSAANRSYGWSLMSDCRQGWQLTGFEKLALGWDSVDNYLFVKSGALTTSINTQSAENGNKGVVVLPEDNGSQQDFYFMEIPQRLGAEATTKTDHSGDGLLLMVAKPSSAQGSISPFVKGRNLPTDAAGASKAPFGKGTSCETNGITISGIGDYDTANKCVTCTITVADHYKAPSAATKLRENEQLAFGNSRFKMDITGNLSFDGFPCLYNGANLDLSGSLKNKDYGFCAYVDRKGIFTLAAATDANQQNPVLVKAFSEVVPAGLSDGDYFFKLEVLEAKPQISIYQGRITDPSPVFKYRLFQSSSQVYSAPFSVKNEAYHLDLQTDGNLALYDANNNWKRSFYTGSQKDITDAITAILIDKTGKMAWLDGNGLAEKTFEGKGGTAPFALSLDSSTSPSVYLVMKDSTGTEKYRILLDDSVLKTK